MNKNVRQKKKRAPIIVSSSDIERAFKKVEEFQNLLKKGKTRQQIIKSLIKLIEIEDESD
ncbi:MAG: hypothetical protein BAJALOKI1v1_2220003 [Promethearchaeota archaeon]|nr:MAG: hypothetical protein BAJALOKI1v1_2220003 [Candidatus Lokiarchaeota archaeon]